MQISCLSSSLFINSTETLSQNDHYKMMQSLLQNTDLIMYHFVMESFNSFICIFPTENINIDQKFMCFITPLDATNIFSCD